MDTARSGQAFGRRSRILDAKEYSAVMRSRLRIGGTLFVGHVQPRLAPGVSRLGLIVPKKFEPSAVRRNAVKRVWREFFRQQAKGSAAFDLVIRLNRRSPPGALAAFKRACRNEAADLWPRITRVVA